MTWWSGFNSVTPLRKPSKLAKKLTSQRLKYRYFLFTIKKETFGSKHTEMCLSKLYCVFVHVVHASLVINTPPTEIRPYNCYIDCRRERALQSELSLHDSDLGWCVWIYTSRMTTRIVWTYSLKPKPVNQEIIRPIDFNFGRRYHHSLHAQADRHAFQYFTFKRFCQWIFSATPSTWGTAVAQ